MDARSLARLVAKRNGEQQRSDGAGGYLVRCPSHADREPSLHISPGKCQAVLVHCLAGCDTAAVLASVGLGWRDICGNAPSSRVWPQVTAEYTYTDATGRETFTVGRIGDGPGKHFKCRRFDETGAVVYGASGVPRTLYHLPEVIAAVTRGETVYLCEGEKDADAMRRAYGICATTNPFGATVWAKDCARFRYDRCLRDARLVVVQHRDAGGRTRSRQLIASLSGVVASLDIVEAAQGNDAADHIAAGRTLEQFIPVATATLALEDDGRFAPLPNAFFAAARSCNVWHLDYRVLIEFAQDSVRRENERAVWQTKPCPSSWLAGLCNDASASHVRRSLKKLREANILLSDGTGDEPHGQALLLRVNGDYAAWRPVRPDADGATPPRAGSDLSPWGTTPVSSGHGNTRETL